MRKLRHWLAHLLGWYHGHVVSFYIDDGFYIAFQCYICGEVNAGHLVCTRSQEDKDHD